MSRYIDADKVLKELHLNHKDVIYIDKNETAKRIEKIPSIDIVKCVDCRKCKEQGGHANCNGYLYCTRQKTMVDEDCFCSWGERERYSEGINAVIHGRRKGADDECL